MWRLLQQGIEHSLKDLKSRSFSEPALDEFRKFTYTEKLFVRHRFYTRGIHLSNSIKIAIYKLLALLKSGSNRKLRYWKYKTYKYAYQTWKINYQDVNCIIFTPSIRQNEMIAPSQNVVIF